MEQSAAAAAVAGSPIGSKTKSRVLYDGSLHGCHGANQCGESVAVASDDATATRSNRLVLKMTQLQTAAAVAATTTSTNQYNQNSGSFPGLFTTVSELEATLERCLAVDIDDLTIVDPELNAGSNSSSSATGQEAKPQRPSVWYFATPDLIWLCCRRLRAKSTEGNDTSLTGLFEVPINSNLHNGAIAPTKDTVSVSVWMAQFIETTEAVNGGDEENNSNRPRQHNGHDDNANCGQQSLSSFQYDWTRRSLSYLPPSSSFGNSLASSDRYGHVVRWIDLRRAQSNGQCTAVHGNDKWSAIFDAPAALFQFLQRALGSSHVMSPWVVNSVELPRPLYDDDKEDAVDCVMVAFAAAPEALVQFRVSDACPSWCLYSSIKLQLAPTDTPWGTLEAEDYPLTNSAGLNQPQACDVLIYRRLPPRERLSSQHPTTKETVPVEGCLWETVVTMPPNDDIHASVTSESVPHKANPQPIISYQLTGPPYIDFVREYGPLQCHLDKLLEPAAMEILRREAVQIDHLWTAWPEQQHYRTNNSSPESTDASNNTQDNGDGTAPWHVFPLCHTFPANDLSRRQWIAATARHVPQTVALLQQHGGDWVRTALFSRLDANSVLEAHTGWADLANHVYRVHIPIDIPPHAICGTWVDGCVVHHRPDALLAFDDSKIHRAFHYTHQPSTVSGGTAAAAASVSEPSRVVLIVDVARPPYLPLGTATGGHSEELDAFIAQFASPS